MKPNSCNYRKAIGKHCIQTATLLPHLPGKYVVGKTARLEKTLLEKLQDFSDKKLNIRPETENAVTIKPLVNDAEMLLSI